MNPECITISSSRAPDSGISDLSSASSAVSLIWHALSEVNSMTTGKSPASALSVPHEVPEDSIIRDSSSVLSSSERLPLYLTIHLRRLACHILTSLAGD